MCSIFCNKSYTNKSTNIRTQVQSAKASVLLYSIKEVRINSKHIVIEVRIDFTEVFYMVVSAAG